MVKTRHNADNDEEVYDEFLTLATRRTRSKPQLDPQVNGYHGGSEGESDDMAEQSQSSRRPKGQRNISIFAGNTTDDETPPRSARRKRYREVQESRPEQALASGRSHRQLRARPTEEFLEEHVEEENSRRRSTRQRKLVYDTFNQSLIDKQLAFYSPEHQIYDDGKPPKKRRYEAESVPTEEVPVKGVDMYTRVKRERLQVKRNMYGVPIADDENKEEGEEETDTSGEEEEEETEEEEQSNSRQYFLREHKPRTKIYEAPIEPKRSRPTNIFRDTTPPRPIVSRRRAVTYSSPARRKNVRLRRKAAFHGSSSTSSSSSDDSDGSDDRRFERRKAKSMTKARTRCLPMNMAPDDMSTGFIRDRVKIGSSLADVDPMNIDKSITFESVGGLGKHVRALKEMVVFPLLYPEVFEKFKITPPRGCLFYGPPGTGKTLVARALANECSSGERRVSFFMRKGADCLSKWVGESERQLRLLFDQAYQMRPSIIFFDEIDGLAPVRSSRQDQIHSSIVSTLLALMDGLDNRGEIVIIGATNRIDSIDPALRRPGRFDREFAFPLPSLQARTQILQIHTKEWIPKLSEPFLAELAEKCAGYCGADMKALCTEACLHALRRRYPQIYNSQDKLQLDVDSIQLSASDFQKATLVIVPTAQRSVTSPARSLSASIQPLLRALLGDALHILKKSYPVVLSHSSSVDMPAESGTNGVEDDLYTDEDEDGLDIFEHSHKGRGKRRLDMAATSTGPFMDQTRTMSLYSASHRPRLLLAGEEGQGQTTHLAPSIMHHMERLPVHVLDLPALYAVSARTPEESCAQIFREAKRTSPSIIYVPHIGQWWEVIGDTTRATFLTLLQDIDPTLPLLFLATNDELYSFLPDIIRRLFSTSAGEVLVMRNPSESERRKYFEDLLLKQTVKPPPTRKQAAQRVLEELQTVAPPEPRQLTTSELKKLQSQEEVTLRELRLFLRDVLNKLGRDRKFAIFTKPVDEEEVPDYYEVIANPMDLSKMMNKIDLHKYETVKEFMDDIELIVSNCLEYNPDKNPADRAIRHRACTLKDTAQAILVAELDDDFEKLCEEIKESKARRGEKSSATVPSYYFTKPLGKGMKNLLQEKPQPSPVDTPDPYNTSNTVSANVFDNDNDNEVVPKIRMIVKKVFLRRAPSRPGSKSPWCRSTKRRYKKVIIYIDEFGNEIPQDKEEENKDEDEEENEMAEGVGKEEEEEEEDAKEADKENINDNDCEMTENTIAKDSINRSPRGRRRGDSPRTRSNPTSPRAGKSPGEDKSPVGSSHSPDDQSKEDDIIKSGDERPRSKERKDDCMSLESTTRTRRSRTFSGNHSESEPMDTKTTSPDHKPQTRAKSPEKTKSPEKAMSPEKAKSPAKQSGEMEEKDTVDEGGDRKESERVMRVTRSQLQPATRQRAIEILEESTQVINVDQDRLEQLLNKAVLKTEGCSIDELERLHSMMSQCLCQHRMNYEKSQLLQDLEATLNSFR